MKIKILSLKKYRACERERGGFIYLSEIIIYLSEILFSHINLRIYFILKVSIVQTISFMTKI